MTIPGNEGKEITKKEFADKNKGTTTTYDSNGNKEVNMTIPGDKGITKAEFEELNKGTTSTTSKTAASTQPKINSAYDYQKYIEKNNTGATVATTKGTDSSIPWNSKPLSQGKNDQITVTPVKEVTTSPTNPKVTASNDYTSYQKTTTQDSNFVGKTFVLNKNGDTVITIENPNNNTNNNADNYTSYQQTNSTPKKVDYIYMNNGKPSITFYK